ncbi:MAG: hypothetical protein ACXWVG_13115 [Telluria sp.]
MILSITFASDVPLQQDPLFPSEYVENGVARHEKRRYYRYRAGALTYRKSPTQAGDFAAAWQRQRHG